MKKHLLLLALAGNFFIANAQESPQETNPQHSNDIMLSPIELIAAPALNLSYERLLNHDSGVGANALIYLGKEKEGLRSQFSPYYRYYFGKKYAAGFFVEGFVPITSTRFDHSDYILTNGNYYYSDPKITNHTTVGVGIGFGGKWITKHNILFEASGGVARRFGADDDSDDGVLTGKGMLGIGYRF